LIQLGSLARIGGVPGEGYGFGLTFAVNLGPGKSANVGSEGEYNWGGAAGTSFWIDPKEHTELPPASPPSLHRIVRRCIEKQPALRFQSAADLGFALQSLALSPVLPPSPARAERPKRRAWLKLAVLAAAASVNRGTAWVDGVKSKYH
jgi:hypothetical protein